MKPKSMPVDESAAAPEAALRKALKYLSRREYYSEELKRKLSRDGCREEAVDEALAALSADGRLSDARFVEAYVAERRRRLYGPERIRLELMNKGFGEDAITRVLVAGDDHWFENAERCYRKRFGETPPAAYGEYAKRKNYLRRRGYSTDVIRRLLPDAPGA